MLLASQKKPYSDDECRYDHFGPCVCDYCIIPSHKALPELLFPCDAAPFSRDDDGAIFWRSQMALHSPPLRVHKKERERRGGEYGLNKGKCAIPYLQTYY